MANIQFIVTILFLLVLALSLAAVIAVSWPNVCIAYMTCLAVLGGINTRWPAVMT